MGGFDYLLVSARVVDEDEGYNARYHQTTKLTRVSKYLLGYVGYVYIHTYMEQTGRDRQTGQLTVVWSTSDLNRSPGRISMSRFYVLPAVRVLYVV